LTLHRSTSLTTAVFSEGGVFDVDLGIELLFDDRYCSTMTRGTVSTEF